MRLNILIGGKAGQGINKVSEIVSKTLSNYGWFTFNYRDYQSLIRGGHNFNVLSIADEWIASHESKVDGIIAMEENTAKIHQKELKKDGFILTENGFEDLGINLNVALAGALIKILGIEKKYILDEIKEQFHNKESIAAAEKGYNSQKQLFSLKKLENKMRIINGNEGITQGAIYSKIDHYFAYPMTPATEIIHKLAALAEKNNLRVVLPENEIAVINMALGANFSGARSLVGTAGGGFDLMTESLSFQGQSEIPLVVYLASRPGPSTGVPTYTSQDDLDVSLRAGHGEFPRIVMAPGDPVECTELLNQAFYLSEKFNALSLVLSDKHLAESEYSINKPVHNILNIESKRKIPQKNGIVKASSYEHDENGNTVESPEEIIQGVKGRLKKYEEIKKEVKKFKMIKIHKNKQNKDSKNLIIGWGSTKGAIIDAINSDNLDAKFLQVLYLKPLSDEIRKEIEKAKNVILVENNVTGQLGRLIREKTGFKIEEKNRILQYDGRPFTSDELKNEIKKRLK